LGNLMNFHSLAFRHELPHLAPRSSNYHRELVALLPLVLVITMALLPPPPGLAQYGCWHLSLFVTVIVGLIVEPVLVPAAAVDFLASSRTSPSSANRGPATRHHIRGDNLPVCLAVSVLVLLSLSDRMTHGS